MAPIVGDMLPGPSTEFAEVTLQLVERLPSAAPRPAHLAGAPVRRLGYQADATHLAIEQPVRYLLIDQVAAEDLKRIVVFNGVEEIFRLDRVSYGHGHELSAGEMLLAISHYHGSSIVKIKLDREDARLVRLGVQIDLAEPHAGGGLPRVRARFA